MTINHIYEGDCLNVLRGFPENSIDSIVTDPPYGLSFMGKKWDYDVPSVEIWQECLRVLKPGGHLLAFAGTRTQHRMAVRIEDAGFEIRDMIAWIYGSGFPKSLNIGKSVNQLGGAFGQAKDELITKGTSEWEGWGTALKPALEPITVARKPLAEKTVAENCLKWGTGGINIDESRVGTEVLPEQKAGQAQIGTFERHDMVTPRRVGRFPANLIHDGSEEVRECFPETKSGWTNNDKQKSNSMFLGEMDYTGNHYAANSGNASRFFYCAKASKSERNEGCEGLEKEVMGMNFGGELNGDGKKVNITANKNHHPTVKPIALMEYLVKLVTPKGGIVCDPFTGSGSTLIAAEKLGFNYIGIELNPEYIEIAQKRLSVIQPRLSM